MTATSVTLAPLTRVPHDRRCAGQIRGRGLCAAGEPTVPDVGVLHGIAELIRECCGHGGLKAHRLAWGWSIPEATKRVHHLCAVQGLGRRGLDRRSWHEWEAGTKRPNNDYQDLLCRLFRTNAARLGFAADHTPISPPVVATWTGHEAAALRTATRMSIRAFAARVGVTTRTVTLWEQATERPLSLAAQEQLDRAFKLADEDTKARFGMLRHTHKQETNTPRAGSRFAIGSEVGGL